MRGWALAEQGQEEEGIAQMRQGLSAWRASGAEHALSNMVTLLAETYKKRRQVEEGLSVLAEGLAAIQRTGEHWWEAELYRLKGELLLIQGGPVAEVEQSFHQAITIARHQQAKSLELRSTISLSQLWQRQGKRTEAYQVLGEIYGWFNEGFDTADLQEARMLLEELV